MSTLSMRQLSWAMLTAPEGMWEIRQPFIHQRASDQKKDQSRVRMLLKA